MQQYRSALYFIPKGASPCTQKIIMNMFFFGPLAQFDLLEKAPSSWYNVWSATGITEFDETALWLFVTVSLWQIYEFYDESSKVDAVIEFDDETLVTDLVSKANYNYNDTITTFFSVIFTANFSGLIPYSQTITSQMVFALSLSMIIMFTVWSHAFYDNKIAMLNHFLPSGSPLVITPFIILIELVSNISRIISLAVRLFANMTSGHALLKILASFGLGALMMTAAWKVLAIFPVIIIFIITILELLIAFLQTYVFVTLTLIYVSEQE